MRSAMLDQVMPPRTCCSFLLAAACPSPSPSPNDGTRGKAFIVVRDGLTNQLIRKYAWRFCWIYSCNAVLISRTSDYVE